MYYPENFITELIKQGKHNTQIKNYLYNVEITLTDNPHCEIRWNSTVICSLYVYVYRYMYIFLNT